MEKASRKSAPMIIITSAAFLSGTAVVEGRERYHTELRQYVEPSKLTYENAAATATITYVSSPFGWDRVTDFGPPPIKFKIRLKSGGGK
jgi:hypothetical protein